MGIFDSIKSALGKGDAEADVTVAPSQLLREAGLDPSGLKFGFGSGSITVSGQIADETEDQPGVLWSGGSDPDHAPASLLATGAAPRTATRQPPTISSAPATVNGDTRSSNTR